MQSNSRLFNPMAIQTCWSQNVIIQEKKTADKEHDVLIGMTRFLIVYLTDSLTNYLYRIINTNLCNQLLVVCVVKNNSCNYVDF